MRLELCAFTVKDIVFSDKTKLENGTLSINREELRAFLNEDGKFEDVEIQIARPEERTRIIHIVDIVEPRLKIGGAGSAFPGFIGPPLSVGEGRTHRLAGMAVVETAEPIVGESTYWREAIIDMSGPCREYTCFSDTINLVLNFKPRKEMLERKSRELVVKDISIGTLEALEYNFSVRVNGLKAASYLAEATRNQEPDKVETYELTPVSPSLPRVVYFCQEIWAYLYGDSPATRYGELPSFLATLIHPNEFMDGALVNARTLIASNRDTTYEYQNFPLIHELYRRHGKELNFAGIVLYRPGGTKMDEKDRVTSYAAKLGGLLGAQGAVLTWQGGGHYGVDVMLLCQKLERMGIPTVIITPEMAKNPDESGFVDYVPEADAIVSVGNYEEQVHLPSMEKVIGGSKILETDYDASNEMVIPLRNLMGPTNRFGLERLTVKEY